MGEVPGPLNTFLDMARVCSYWSRTKDIPIAEEWRLVAGGRLAVLHSYLTG